MIGDKLHKKGAEFTKVVFDFVSSLREDLIIGQEVEINPRRDLRADTDLGDIDVLIIDKTRKVIFLLECKKMEVAKNVKQIVEEMNNLFGSESERGWIDKHNDRYKWIKDNLNLLESKFSMSLNEYSIVPVILTSEELPTKHLKSNDLPFGMISFYNLREKGLDALI